MDTSISNLESDILIDSSPIVREEPMKAIKSIHQELYHLSLLEDNVVYVDFLQDCDIDISLSKTLIEQALILTENKPFKGLYNLHSFKISSDKTTQQYLASNKRVQESKLKEALIMNSFTLSLLAGVYLRIYQPATPTKCFAQTADGLKWLKE